MRQLSPTREVPEKKEKGNLASPYAITGEGWERKRNAAAGKKKGNKAYTSSSVGRERGKRGISEREEKKRERSRGSDRHLS